MLEAEFLGSLAPEGGGGSNAIEHLTMLVQGNKVGIKNADD